MANVNVENGLTVNGVKTPSEDDVAVIGSAVIAAKVLTGNGAKVIAHVKRDDVKRAVVKPASVLNANGPGVNRAVRIC